MTWELLHADCRQVMANMGDATVDAVVCDPPYHLTSIVKRFGPGQAPQQFGTDGAPARAARGFMGQTWDGGDIAFDPTLWAEVLRVLKPGGHLIAFSGTRTYHRMACAIEDAGFEIRDMLEWLYGSGFPKGGLDDEGRGAALKPAHEPMCLGRKPFKGSAASCVETYGTGLLNIDACRLLDGTETGGQKPEYVANHANAVFGVGMGGGAYENTNGRFPANVLHDGLPDDWSRYFYCAKASKRDRDEGCEHLALRPPAAMQGNLVEGQRLGGDGSPIATPVRRNIHPTVKPTDLMRWLVRLVTPPGGLVFDPFAGSGSTGKAAMLEGLRFIGAEMTAEYLPIAKARIAWGAAEYARLTGGSN